MPSQPLSDLNSAIIKADLQEIIPPELIASLKIRHYRKNETVMVTGNELNYFYIILEGKVAIHNSSEKGNVAVVDYVEKRGLLGDIEYFHKCNYLHTAIAAIPTDILLIPLEIMQTHLTKSVSFLMFMCSSITEKLMKSSIKNARSLLYPARNKLCKYMLQMSEKSGIPFIPFINKDIASTLGISDRHLRRLLGELIEEKIVLKENKTVTILDIEKLNYYSSYF
ncbi:Crp/Fnr family transcriptional regulator [Paenibacillus pinihumi]|uniref:Crp/Fnr family transcriptional regulator n=1 Tax=Paenibacillus pinihumi TaxID=669462 RepID=UPI0004068271|nr:Crp/Fnr family transcriptional regulator [Paenibacillus pinihumi]